MQFIIFRYKSKGMTFAEILVAIGLVSVVLVVMIGTLIAGLEALQKGTGYNQANIIAQRTVELYRSMEYSSIPVEPEIITYEPGFIVKTNIAESIYPSTGALKYKKVTVNVFNRTETQAKSVNVKMIIYLFPDIQN